MAYDDSGELSLEQSTSMTSQGTYTLGDYEFYLLVSKDPVNDKTYISAECTKGTASGSDGITLDGVVDVESWRVEANETEASVYIKTAPVEDLYLGPVLEGETLPREPEFGYTTKWRGAPYASYEWSCERTLAVGQIEVGERESTTYFVFASSQQTSYSYTVTPYYREDLEPTTSLTPLDNQFTYAGKTVYYKTYAVVHMAGDIVTEVHGALVDKNIDNWSTISFIPSHIAWMLVYGDVDREGSEFLVARFAIDLRDADGGPDGSWDEPGDTGDPTKTLEVVIFGSDAGRHVDPLDRWDPTHYQYWPADQEQAWNYGCGGDGGHGGGGGGGSAAVFVKDFATNKADGKIIELHCGRHGYGSGGGKGGQGGDGCIIVYW